MTHQYRRRRPKGGNRGSKQSPTWSSDRLADGHVVSPSDEYGLFNGHRPPPEPQQQWGGSWGDAEQEGEISSSTTEPEAAGEDSERERHPPRLDIGPRSPPPQPPLEPYHRIDGVQGGGVSSSQPVREPAKQVPLHELLSDVRAIWGADEKLLVRLLGMALVLPTWALGRVLLFLGHKVSVRRSQTC
eukprot:TRINITY_DN22766_c0_g1_i1.p1 TRINITY_DN22766_c0_g1~~TRINITY_DN22766_c0_g1_i1.p1  ORF type:complete len:201 (+),score=18.79 TRINITY_DN22766_c0_g1_i1:43-603(+)